MAAEYYSEEEQAFRIRSVARRVANLLADEQIVIGRDAPIGPDDGDFAELQPTTTLPPHIGGVAIDGLIYRPETVEA